MNQAQVGANVNPLRGELVAFVADDTLPEGKVSLSALCIGVMEKVTQPPCSARWERMIGMHLQGMAEV
jgi:hypothetical protein